MFKQSQGSLFFYLLMLCCIFLLYACIEPYEFRITDNKASLVIEGFISDASFQKTKTYPSDGRYFSINLSYTNDVINIKGDNVYKAQVTLNDDTGESWKYTEIPENTPNYLLLDDNFHAEVGKSYQLLVKLPDGSSYESEWVSLPETNAPEMGEIGFIEEEEPTYVYISGEEKIRNVQGMRATVSLPKNSSGKTIYYKWQYEPTWIYRTPLPTYIQNSVDICWASNESYIGSFDLAEDIIGGFDQTLFYMRTVGNERIYDEFSTLITQQVMNKEYYFFNKELKERSATGLLFDKLPYNLPTNMKANENTNQVYGFFGIVKEQAKRWYFNKDDLSYFIENNLAENCIKYSYGTPAAECINCLDYTHGDAVAEAPLWWAPQ